LVGVHIPEYLQGNRANHDPDRPRKLLLHRREIDRLYGQVREKGVTLVPTRMYFKDGRVKVEIAVGRGKELHDKRRDIATRDGERLASVPPRVALGAGAERDAGVVDTDLVSRHCLVAVPDDDVLDAEVERDVPFGLLDGGALEWHGGTLATMWSNTHTGATWFRRGRSIRVSCKPRSPVGLVNPPATNKCESS